MAIPNDGAISVGISGEIFNSSNPVIWGLGMKDQSLENFENFYTQARLVYARVSELIAYLKENEAKMQPVQIYEPAILNGETGLFNESLSVNQGDAPALNNETMKGVSA